MAYREYWVISGDHEVPRTVRVGFPVRTSEIMLGWLAITAATFWIIFEVLA